MFRIKNLKNTCATTKVCQIMTIKENIDKTDRKTNQSKPHHNRDNIGRPKEL